MHFAILVYTTSKHSTLTVWATEVSNLIWSPHFRSSASIYYKSTSFVIGVPTSMLLFYQYSGHSILSIIIIEIFFLFLCLTNHTIIKKNKNSAYLRFTPSPYAKHFPSLSYRGGWHRVSQGFYYKSLYIYTIDRAYIAL